MKILRKSQNLVIIGFVAILMSCLTIVSINQAYAVVEGCDDRIWTAMKDRAQVKVAYDIGVTESIIKKPDSVLMMTCFDDSTEVSAVKGGAIFSGNFTGGLANVVNAAFTNFVNNFAGSIGEDADWNNVIGADKGSLFSGNGNYSCDTMQEVWDEIMTHGLTEDVNFGDFDELLAANIAGAATILNDNLSAESPGVIDNLNASIAALPLPSIPDFTGDDSLEKVLKKAKIM